MSATLAHSIHAVAHWGAEAERLMPRSGDREYREAYRQWDAALVSRRAVREQAHRLATVEVSEDPDIVEMFLGFSTRSPFRPVSRPRVLAAYVNVDRAYRASLAGVSNGGLVHSMMLDVTRTALKAWLDTL